MAACYTEEPITSAYFLRGYDVMLRYKERQQQIDTFGYDL